MKNLILIYALLLIVSPLLSHSIKFVAMDRYYEEVVPIDSILVHDMNTGEEKLYQTDSLFFETVSSVEELTNENSLHLYPNPVEDILNINTNSSEIIISDISGKVHYKSSTVISGNVSLNVAGLLQGVYAIRTGNKSQTFIKNTPSNGQDVRLLSSSNSQSSLVKEVEVQSQFDNRFTIYSDGFKPKNYYTKALTKDTVVELDMIANSISLFGNKMRFEIYLKDVDVKYSSYSHYTQGNYIYKNEIEDRSFEYEDSIVIRNNKIELFYKEENQGTSKYHSNKLDFLIDTMNKTILNMNYNNNYRNFKNDDSKSYVDELNYSFSFANSIDYNDGNRVFLLISLDKFDFEHNYSREEITSYNCPGHFDFTSFGSFDRAKSYIKIEFID
ncbi:MAG: T9SS type A sorting domain-containing protein [Candidatus Kapaibacterium sp.]|nr:T9SS type A sorting domain-containing protein [Ignavibacteriota bacterium]